MTASARAGPDRSATKWRLVYENHARTYRRTWRGSAISTFLSPILFLVSMGIGLGTLVDRTGADGLGGLSYLAFIAPGLLVATAMQTGTGDSSWPVMAGIRWIKTYHAALATPVSTTDLVLGHLTWVATRLTMVSIIYGAIMAFFGAVSWTGAALAIIPAVITGMSFAAPMTAFTSWIDKETALTNVFRFGITPLFLFSGVFFPIEQLPDFIEPLAYLVPVWHGVEAARSITSGLAAPLPLWVHYGYLAAWVLVGTYLAIRLFDRRMRV